MQLHEQEQKFGDHRDSSMAYIKEKSRLDFNMNVISGGVKNCFQRNIKNVMNYWIAVFEKGIIVKPIVLLLILE